MPTVPTTLEEAIAQAQTATQAALDAGCGRIQIDLAVPEIALQAQAIALQFAPLFSDYGSGLKLLFPDAGAASLARRDWQETPFSVSDLGSRRTPVDIKISDTDEIFLVISPSPVEVQAVERLCTLAGDRPVILLIPQLEDVSVVGIGYAARQLRERFLSTIETAYYFKASEGAAIVRAYPSPWQVWLETEGEYQPISEESQKPDEETLKRLLAPTTDSSSETETSTYKPKKAGFLANMQQFLRALNQ